eukprot:g44736.t1
MMQAPWLTVNPTSEEVRVKHDLANRLNSLRSQQQAEVHCVEMWHKKALTELEKKPEKQRIKRKVNVQNRRNKDDIRSTHALSGSVNVHTVTVTSPIKADSPDCCPKKVKVKGPRTPSTVQIPFDTSTAMPQNVALRSSAQEIIKEQEENVR